LRLSEIQKRQIELARQYGIYGFCFHYYWFGGARLLERPLDQFLKDPAMDFPFCICWANENWTRRWDGKKDEVLIGQVHNPKNDEMFIKDILPILKDPRYIRVDGRPVLIVYRLRLLPDPEKTVRLWRDYCRSEGIDLYLIAVQTYNLQDSRNYSCDATVEFPPHNMCGLSNLSGEVGLVNSKFCGHILSYESYVKQKTYLKCVPYTQFKCVVPSWDNTPRKPLNPTILHGSTPELYKEWLADAINYNRKEANKDNLVFINAWNEWAEGAHLEPDRKYGYAYLEATAEAILKSRREERAKKQGGVPD
jgi:lipopolysaccharide biosynthesis protein